MEEQTKVSITEQIKLSEEELIKIKRIREEYANKINEFGNLKLDKIFTQQKWDLLLAEEKKLEQELISIQESEKILANELDIKYGAGNINLETGLFTKI